jgi:hypothetical protein
LSEPDFVRCHLSVELQNLLACYDYDDDDDSDQPSVDMFTMDDPDTGSESGVNNLITDENIPGVVPPSISVPLNNPVSLDDLAYQPESTNDFTGNPNDAPSGSTEVSIELEVAKKYSHELFTRQEQSMTKLSLFFSTGCRLSLFNEVLSHIKKDVKLGHLNFETVSTRKTFLACLRLKVPVIAIASTDVCFPPKKGHPSRKFTVSVFDLLAQLQDMLDDFTVYGNVNKLNVNTDQKNWFHPKASENSSVQYSEVHLGIKEV